jgi:uncharacterized protein (TIGR02118 family)
MTMDNRAIRRFTFVKYREGQTHEAFLAHWKWSAQEDGVHHSYNEAQPSIGDLIPEPLWHGLLETGLDAADRLETSPLKTFAGEADGVVDPEQLVEFLAEPKVVLDGPARGVKILSLPRRRAGLSPADFSRHYRGVHGELVARNDAFMKFANRYVQHHVLAHTVRATGGLLPYDGISEFWFDSLDHARSAWDAPSYMAELRADEKNFVGSPPSHRLLVVPKNL